jgi:2-phosphosulfolactate phosphatase
MQIEQVWRDDAERAQGVAIVIDVLRAFSVAAYAFAGGAQELWLVRTVEEALALREREPAALLAGEVGGKLISGFDFNNSPFLMAQADVRDRIIIQRTGAGTQGAVNAANARHLLLAALVNAQATADYARALALQEQLDIALIPTEHRDSTHAEDEICATYLTALIQEQAGAGTVLADGLRELQTSGRLDIFAQDLPDFPQEDVASALATNVFDFVMVGTRRQWRDIAYVEAQRADVL